MRSIDASLPVSANSLSRTYGGGKGIVNVNFTLTPGTSLGLVGENGSGKSTLLRCLLGLEAHEGQVQLFGRSPRDWRSLAGIAAGVLDGAAQHGGLRVGACVKMTAALQGQAWQDEAELLEMLGLPSVWGERFGTLSLGWKQRLMIALALMSRPGLLLLDEPFNGLDVKAVADLTKTLKQRQSEGLAVIIASHHLDSVEELCQDVMHLERGVVTMMRLGAQQQDVSRPVLVVGLTLELATELFIEVQMSVRIRESSHGLLIVGLSPQQINGKCVEAGIVLTQLRYVGGELEHRLAANNTV